VHGGGFGVAVVEYAGERAFFLLLPGADAGRF
jgi:hypothetical protein